MTPYYSDDAVTIYHGDARDVLSQLSPVDVVFTSPPYNRGNMSGGLANLSGGYASYDDEMPWPDYLAWQRQTLTDCWNLLTSEGVIFYNHKPRIQEGEVWLPLELNPGLPLRQIIIWHQVVGVNWNASFFIPTHEWLMMFAKPAFRLASRSASNAGDVWRIRTETSKSGREDHPASFPLKLPTTALAALPVGRSVLDPFMGSGTTLRAAKDCGHKAIGIELDERYCEIAAKRMSQEVLDFGAAS